MGFVCYFCGNPQAARVSAHKVVTQYRQFNHPCRPKAMRRKVIKNGKKKWEYVTDPGGLGLQIVQEVLSCPGCAAQWDRDQRVRQGLLPDAPAPKVILPVITAPAREISPEQRPRRFNNNRPAGSAGWRKPPEGTTAGGTLERSFQPRPHQPNGGPRPPRRPPQQ
jgi:hypothetical protein